MRLELITGRSGCGKTSALMERIKAAHSMTTPCVLIVPDDATYQVERDVMERLGHGLTDIDVTGFTRLASRVLSSAGGGARAFLDGAGRRMTLRRLIAQNAGSLEFYRSASARPGFTEKLGELINAFRYNRVTPEALLEAAGALADSDALLAAKLHDTAIIYGEYDKYLGDSLTDGIGRQELMAWRIKDCEYIKQAHVFIDGLFSFTSSKQLYGIIEELIKTAGSVTVALCVSEYASELFSGEAQLAKRLEQTARELGAEVIITPLSGFKRKAPECARHIESELFSQAPPLPRPSAGLTLHRALDASHEVSAMLEQVLLLLKNGASCPDIAIVAGGQDYFPHIRRALDWAKLPFFMDQSRTLSTHPVVETLLASIDAARNNFRPEDVLRAAKSGFSPLDDGEAEVLEDYANRFGVRFSGFTKTFTKGEATFPDFALAEDARAKLMQPLVKLQSALKASKLPADFCAAVYAYIQDIRLFEQLIEAGGALSEDDLSENAQICGAITELLDQIALLMPGEMDAAQFESVFREGLAAHTIGVVPQLTGSITVGGKQKLSLRGMKHLFVLGCNEGLMPVLPPDDGIINDADIRALASKNIEAFNPSPVNAIREKYEIYACMTRPEKSLYVSCALHDHAGAPLQPSEVYLRLEKLFPDAPGPESTEYALCEHTAFSRLLKGLSGLREGILPEPHFEQYLAYFSSGGRGEALFALTGRELGASGIPEQDARALYGGIETISATRLELYNGCPFRYLVRCGLRPDEPRPYQPEALDDGNYYHAALDALFIKLAKDGTDIAELTEESCGALLDGMLDGIEKGLREEVYKETPHSRIIAGRIRKGVKKTAWAAVRQLRAGVFRPLGTEVSVGGAKGKHEMAGSGMVSSLPALELKAGGRTIRFTGNIDRIDGAEDGEAVKYVRVIDYKTGDDDFSEKALIAGTKMQLPLYLKAASRLGKPAGMFYMHAGDPALEAGADGEALQKQYKLNGRLSADGGVPRMMDADSSSFSPHIPVRFLKDGLGGTALMTQEELDNTLAYAVKKAESTLESILSGKNAPAPKLPSENGVPECRYCGYDAICRFDSTACRFGTVSAAEEEEYARAVSGSEKKDGEK